MKKIDKSRELLLGGITMHLKGFSLKDIQDFYEKQFILQNIEDNDKALIKYLTLTTIRNRGIIEKIMRKFLKKPLKKKLLEPKSGIMLGITQILYSKIPGYAAVNSVVNLYNGKKEKWKPLVNALLRKVNSEKISFKTEKNNNLLNIPDWLKNSWLKQYGKITTNKIINSIFEEPIIDLKIKRNINNLKKSLNAKILIKNTLRLKSKGDIKSLEGFKEGMWWVQDIAAQLPVKIMGNIKNKNIIEICGAPGGKTAQMLNEGAAVTTIEISKRRALMLKNNIERLKLESKIKIICEDARKWVPEKKADITLVDVPCSSTGTLRKNPDVMWLKSQEDIKELVSLQKELLAAAIKCTNKNGIIIYCNCSLQFEEGESVVDYFLQNSLVKLTKVNKKNINGYPMEIINKGFIRTLPFMYNEYGGMDGFFIARLRKTSL